MTLVKWQPFSDLVGMYDRINRMFADEFISEQGKGGMALSSWIPLTDIIETKDAYVFKIELPGFKKEDIGLEYQNDTLTIRGERRQEEEVNKEHYHRFERSYGGFQRSFTLPKNADSKRIDASLKDGLLVLTVPKAEEAKAKSIQISVK